MKQQILHTIIETVRLQKEYSIQILQDWDTGDKLIVRQSFSMET